MADPSKTEKATPRKKQEFRKKGSVVKSTELNTVLVLIASFFLLKFSGKYIFIHFSDTVTYYLSNIHVINVAEDDLALFFMKMIGKVLVVIVPFMLVIFATAFISNLLQVGFLLTIEPIKPSFGKINALKGLANLFSKKSLENFVKSMTKVSLIGYIAYATIRDNIPTIINFFNIEIQNAFFTIASLAMSILAKVILVFLVFAVFDYLWQKYMLDQKMKMTKQEIKEEHKRTEGDPQIKGEIRRRQMQMAQSRMMQEVPKADVVITNPFHVAVAISYNAQSMAAPIIIAKGVRKIAEKIKEIAKENEVPIVENAPLARSLYKAGTVGKEIPSDLYGAVAEVLTYIFKLSGKTFGI